MGSYFTHAFLSEKGEGFLSRYPYTLVMESVTTYAGEAFLGFLSGSEAFAGQVLSWFYDDVITIFCHYGASRLVLSSFGKIKDKYRKNFAEENMNFAGILLFHGHFYAFRNGSLQIRKIREYKAYSVNKNYGRKRKEDAFLIGPDAFFKAFTNENIGKILGRNNQKMQTESEISRRLSELRRREIGRTVNKGTGMIYVR